MKERKTVAVRARRDLLSVAEDALVKRALGRAGAELDKTPPRVAVVELALRLLIHYCHGELVEDVRDAIQGDISRGMVHLLKEAKAAGCLRRDIGVESYQVGGTGRPRVRWVFGDVIEEDLPAPQPATVIFPVAEVGAA